MKKTIEREFKIGPCPDKPEGAKTMTEYLLSTGAPENIRELAIACCSERHEPRIKH